MMRTTAAILNAIAAACETRRPEEACGFLFGTWANGHADVTAAEPTDNVWPTAAERGCRYAIDPLAQLRADQAATDQGNALVGMYHSHPHGPAVPSAFDTDRAWPGYIYLIVGFDAGAGPRPRAWGLDSAGRFVEHQILSEKSI